MCMHNTFAPWEVIIQVCSPVSTQCMTIKDILIIVLSYRIIIIRASLLDVLVC